MEILDLTEPFYRPYFCCLEEWSDEMKDAGDHKEIWFNRMKGKGLRVKLAVEGSDVCGMIQYLPIEESFVEGQDLYVITCIWVHGYKKGVGNHQKRGIGSALLAAAENDVQSMDKKGMVAWGISLPFWMRASWFKKHGYKKVDTNRGSILLWKPFQADANVPHWIRPKKKPGRVAGKVTVTSFINGWCPAQNIVHERAKRASLHLGASVEFQEIQTANRATFEEWGICDALFIDGKQVRSGPPPSYTSIKRKIERRAKKVTQRH